MTLEQKIDYHRSMAVVALQYNSKVGYEYHIKLMNQYINQLGDNT